VVKQRIAIVCLGLIGGSLARRLAYAGCEILAWDPNDRPY
jgi:Lactate dehydrogenase and related dehydrogenases